MEAGSVPGAGEPNLTGARGHFTAMQVRHRATRGLGLHLDRLRAANREMFATGLDVAGVRERIRRALGDAADASVRVYVVATDDRDEPETIVTVRPPGGIVSPQRLRSVDYVRPYAHLKHLATEQGAYTRLARNEGFDDALLTGDGDLVAEAATANVGFLAANGVVWPEAPVLRGITMQLLDTVVAHTTRRVRLRDVTAFEGAFVCNARGIALVSAIDDLALPDARVRVGELLDAYDAIAWDPI